MMTENQRYNKKKYYWSLKWLYPEKYKRRLDRRKPQYIAISNKETIVFENCEACANYFETTVAKISSCVRFDKSYKGFYFDTLIKTKVEKDEY